MNVNKVRIKKNQAIIDKGVIQDPTCKKDVPFEDIIGSCRKL
jgi:hypothetical protein